MSNHILIVDDDALLRRSLSYNLERHNYRTSTADNAESALALSRRDMPDLVLLDIGLPGMDGLDGLRAFQKEFNVPVIMLTARRRELDEVLGLELGADDYITKPFDLDVLVAHIKAVLRRYRRDSNEPSQQMTSITIGDLSIDPAAHTVTLRGQNLDLSPREFALLHTLALEPGKVLSTSDLLERVWGAEYIGEPQVVYVHIRWLREKLENNPNQPERIITVRGVGYKLQAQEI